MDLECFAFVCRRQLHPLIGLANTVGWVGGTRFIFTEEFCSNSMRSGTNQNCQCRASDTVGISQYCVISVLAYIHSAVPRVDKKVDGAIGKRIIDLTAAGLCQLNTNLKSGTGAKSVRNGGEKSQPGIVVSKESVGVNSGRLPVSGDHQSFIKIIIFRNQPVSFKFAEGVGYNVPGTVSQTCGGGAIVMCNLHSYDFTSPESGTGNDNRITRRIIRLIRGYGSGRSRHGKHGGNCNKQQ